MVKSQVPIDPMDGLPDVPLMVEQGMSIQEALLLWSEVKTFPRPLSHRSSQERQQSSQGPC